MTDTAQACEWKYDGDYVLLDTRRCVAVLCVCLISIIPFWTGLCVASINIGNDGAKIGSVSFGEDIRISYGQPRTFRPFHRFVHHAPLLTGNNRLQYRGNSYNPSKPSNQRILAWAVTFGFSVYCWERGICNHASGFRWRGVFWIGLGILGAVLLSGLILLERWWDIFRHLTDLTLAFWGISWA